MNYYISLIKRDLNSEGAVANLYFILVVMIIALLLGLSVKASIFLLGTNWLILFPKPVNFYSRVNVILFVFIMILVLIQKENIAEKVALLLFCSFIAMNLSISEIKKD